MGLVKFLTQVLDDICQWNCFLYKWLRKISIRVQFYLSLFTPDLMVVIIVQNTWSKL